MNNSICHIEFQVTDLARSQAFYEGLFGWTFRSFMDGMVVFGIGDQHIGGLQKVDKPTPGDSPSIWFRVENLDDLAAKARQLGGSTPHDKHPVPGVGHSLAIVDPDGNAVGLVQYEC